MNSPVASALNGVPERYRYARVVMGKKSVVKRRAIMVHRSGCVSQL
jgi:hypothetical protein